LTPLDQILSSWLDAIVAIPREVLEWFFDLLEFFADFAEGNPRGPFAHG
jgi:hypothetical protein